MVRNAACPTCHGPLDWVTSPIRCPNCRTRFEMVRGIPVLLSVDSVNPHKERQAEFFDWADAEFEIARPHGTTALYGWLVSEKLQRSVEALRTVPSAATALSVCGGSGMEAEFLARRGARVVLADISLGAVERALERARRFGFELTGVVADAERLPFRTTRSISHTFMTACTISSGPMRLSQKWHALHGEPSPSMSPRALSSRDLLFAFDYRTSKRRRET